MSSPEGELHASRPEDDREGGIDYEDDDVLSARAIVDAWSRREAYLDPIDQEASEIVGWFKASANSHVLAKSEKDIISSIQHAVETRQQASVERHINELNDWLGQKTHFVEIDIEDSSHEVTGFAAHGAAILPLVRFEDTPGQDNVVDPLTIRDARITDIRDFQTGITWSSGHMQ